MKTTLKFAGIFFIVMLASNMSLNAQYGMHGMMGNNGMYRMRMDSDSLLRHRTEMRGDLLRMRGMRSDMSSWRNAHRGQFMDHRQMYGMYRGNGMRANDRRGWGPAGTGKMMLESIPNVTETQKKEIAELLQKQQDDMKKIREELSAKIQTIRETNRKSLYNILTDEQKKYIDAKQGNTDSNPPAKK